MMLGVRVFSVLLNAPTSIRHRRTRHPGPVPVDVGIVVKETVY
jgi:hypothetical protein